MLQHLPFFALSNRFFKNIYSTFYQATMVFDNAFTRKLISIQHYTFLPMMLVARFGAPASSDRFLPFHLPPVVGVQLCEKVCSRLLVSFWPTQAHSRMCTCCSGFYAMTSFHLLAKGRPAIYKPFEVAAFLGFFVW